MLAEQNDVQVELTQGERAHAVHQPEAAASAAHDADPYAVIEFLLKKIEEQQHRIGELDAYQELLNTEVEALKSQLHTSRNELEQQLADYDVLMQNSLVQEQELESLRAVVREHQQKQAQPRIQLPFHTSQRLANLGFNYTTTPSHRVAG